MSKGRLNMEKRFNKNKNDVPVETSLDKELDLALKNIHQRYGNDFQAFLREIKESLRKQGKLRSGNTESYQL